MRRALLLSLAAAVTFVATPALANDALGLGVRKVAAGKQTPAILLQPTVAAKSVTFVLTNKATGKKLKLKAKKLKAGVRREIKIKQAPGHIEWTGEGTVVWANGKRETFKTSFSTTQIGKLKLQMTPADIDMDARKLQFKATNPVMKATLKLVGEGGKVIGEVEETFEDNTPGQVLSLDWSGEADEPVVFMEFKVWDVAKFWVAIRITPFSIEIPHDDVVFSSGSAAISKVEAPKLKKTMAHINDALAKHGTLLELKLFVAGFTDTVGDKGYNKGLSTQRARSIARWFRRHGLKVAIYYQGFGESALAVKTPDNTPEPRNRRALYILSSQTPATSKQLPSKKWRKL